MIAKFECDEMKTNEDISSEILPRDGVCVVRGTNLTPTIQTFENFCNFTELA